MTENLFRLPDDRVLAYAIYGPVDGYPVLYFHGTPSSRLEIQFLKSFDVNIDELLEENNLKLIAIDRPGIGLSTFNPKVNFLSFADDVKQLADHLDITNCAALCWSGGGPYALAAAHQYPAIIPCAFIICGFSRKFDKNVLKGMGRNKWYFRFAKYSPWLLRSAMNLLRKKNTKKLPPRRLVDLPHVDYDLLNIPKHLRAVSKFTMKEACRNGSKGVVHEAMSYYNDFGFSLSNIQQPVHFWWGTEDRAVIRLHAEAAEKQIPNSIMHYKNGEGHLSIYVNYMTEVLQSISAAVY